MEITNLSKIKREKMLATLEEIKKNTKDQGVLSSLNLIENELNEKKYGLVWEEHEERVDKELKSKIPTFIESIDNKINESNEEQYNFLIEGDNLHSLYLLEKTHNERIDLIYIDPPYNRGKDDFIYNDDYISEEDAFTHSKWLSFMYKRLAVARNLLAPHGTIFISIDDNEFSQLRFICDEIFGVENYLGTLHWRRRNSQPNDKTKLIGVVAEYILVYSKDLNELNKLGIGKVGVTGKFTNPDNDPRGPWATKPWKIAEGRSGTKYEIVSPTGKVFNETWSGTKETFEEALKEGKIIFTNGGNGLPRKKYYLSEREEEGQCANNWWDWETYGSNQEATDELKKIFDGICPFDNPKPTKLIKNIIKLGCVKKDAIILDFFAGSGTTGDAVLKLNKEDGGNRTFILCTDNSINGFKILEYLHDNKLMLDYNPGNKTKQVTIFSKINSFFEDKKELEKKLFIDNKEELEKYGICQNITYPRLKSIITGRTISGNEIAEKMNSNLKYYKTSYIPRFLTDDDSLHNKLMENIVNLIQLENQIEIDGKRIRIYLDEDEFDSFCEDSDACKECEKVYISSDILLTNKEKRILLDNNIKLFTIPEYYFDKEIKEAI